MNVDSLSLGTLGPPRRGLRVRQTPAFCWAQPACRNAVVRPGLPTMPQALSGQIKKTPPKRGFNNARNRGSCSASFGVAPHLGGAAATLNRQENLIDVVLQIRYPFRGGITCPFRPCRLAAYGHGCAPRLSGPRRSSPLSSATDRQRTPRSATRGA